MVKTEIPFKRTGICECHRYVTSLCRKVDHYIEVMLLEEAVNERFVCKVPFYESVAALGMLCRFCLNLLQTIFLQAHVIIIIDRVEAHNLDWRLRFQQSEYQVATYETGGSCD